MRTSTQIVKGVAVSLMVQACLAFGSMAGGVSGTFVQLNREVSGKTVEEWRNDLVQMRQAGLRTLIVQWSAEEKTSYFKNDMPFDEKFDTLERIFEAIGDDPVDVYLGLEHDPNFWTEITARERTLRDYFLVRISRNLKLQQGLLKAFGQRKNWRGYYIPEELDDKTWRSAHRGRLMGDYLKRLTWQLKKADSGREVCVSTFFRGRTAPDVYARNLVEMTRDTGVDHVLVQDGAGEGDPPLKYVPKYYQALQEGWGKGTPDLWCVIEVFQRIDGGKSFKAVPAPVTRLQEQLKYGRLSFTNLVLFTFFDYADPDLGKTAGEAFSALKAP